MKVICINDSGRPNEIPINKWIKKCHEYHVKKVIKCNAQGGIFGYELHEIDLSDCLPYLYFNANRFKLPQEDEVKVVEEELEFA